MISLDIATLRVAYESGALRPADVVREVHERIRARGDDKVWISRVPLRTLLERAAAVEAQRRAGAHLPLYGIPFAVKDNIDVAGVPTTAACPRFAYTPGRSATVVERLLQAGAIYVGKTNLDQFATGLVGTRSPYGACPNAFNPAYISGGSSSGSAVAVAAGLVSFALGTDTAGSGRVPAAFNNIVGFKPTRGLLSTAGVVPACRSLDCVSIFALTSDDAQAVLDVAAGFDPRDPYSRPPGCTDIRLDGDSFRFGVPAPDALAFFGDETSRLLYESALRRLEALGGSAVEIDFSPFREAAALLYEGPYVAERLASLADFVRTHPDAVHPVVREIVSKGAAYSAVDAFRAQQRLQELKALTDREWRNIDVLALPTAPTIYTIEQVLAEPITLNSTVGYYTNFVNLLDLSAIALPADMRPDGLPFGVTLIAPAFHEPALGALGARYQRATDLPLGATPHRLPQAAVARAARPETTVRLAVVGAHLSGQPLNYQLAERDARLVRTCRTSRHYRLYALPGVTPARPGLLLQENAPGPGIEVEVWEMPLRHFGSFVAAVPAPLVIGTITLEDGERVKGFLCESHATAQALDITEYGGWRNYLRSLSAA